MKLGQHEYTECFFPKAQSIKIVFGTDKDTCSLVFCSSSSVCSVLRWCNHKRIHALSTEHKYAFIDGKSVPKHISPIYLRWVGKHRRLSSHPTRYETNLVHSGFQKLSQFMQNVGKFIIARVKAIIIVKKFALIWL